MIGRMYKKKKLIEFDKKFKASFIVLRGQPWDGQGFHLYLQQSPSNLDSSLHLSDFDVKVILVSN